MDQYHGWSGFSCFLSKLSISFYSGSLGFWIVRGFCTGSYGTFFGIPWFGLGAGNPHRTGPESLRGSEYVSVFDGCMVR